MRREEVTKRKENKGSDKGMPSTKALSLILSVIKTSPVAFHPSQLTGEGTGNTDTVLFSWTGNPPSAALFFPGWRGMLLFFVQYVNLQAHRSVQIISSQH